MDAEGYPEEHELDDIVRWPLTSREDYFDLLEYVEELWKYPDYWKRDGHVFRVSTGGWSGNEDLIGALQGNPMFWSVCWESSRRGGHYVFEVPVWLV